MSDTEQAMPPPSKIPRLTLIVATTPSNGIGRGGTLPWPRIKSEMAYFSRVTKRVPPGLGGSNNGSDGGSDGGGGGGGGIVKNAVVMGRKTWDSIPGKFRPLPGRINVVVSRTPGSVDVGPGGAEGPDPTHAASSLRAGLELLAAKHGGAAGAAGVGLGRVFVIGGAQIYGEALELPETDRVLLTLVAKDYDCDTFFPIPLGARNDLDASHWDHASDEERDEFLGEQGTTGGDEWSVQLWKRSPN